LDVTPVPRVLSLGPYRLLQGLRILEVGPLPFVEEGGSYTVRTGAEYSFQDAAGALGRVTIVKEIDVTVGPEESDQMSLSVTTVTLNLSQSNTETVVRRSLGSDAFLELHLPEAVVVQLDSRAWSEGRPTTLWDRPAGLRFLQGGRLMGAVSLLPPTVYYGSEALDAQTAVAVLTAFETATQTFDPGPITLPSRND
jgi:hypothetical protein